MRSNARHRMKIRGRTRHILIVSGVLLLVCAAAIGFIVNTDYFFPNRMSMPAGNFDYTDGSSSPASSQQESVSSEPGSSSPESETIEVDAPKDSSHYQAMYPDLYAKPVQAVPESGRKTVYLTFDDGPSNLTIPLLDVLDRYKVKATFFVVGKTDARDFAAMKAIVDRGHVIGVHSYTHRYAEIYASPAAFLTDFAKMHDLIEKATGVNTQIYRFAGGSVNDYDRATARTITSEMSRRGYVYYDWNVSCGDAEGHSTAKSIYWKTIQGVYNHRNSVILLHNSSNRGDTLSQVPRIIETLQKAGYQFKTLDPTVDTRSYNFPLPKN